MDAIRKQLAEFRKMAQDLADELARAEFQKESLTNEIRSKDLQIKAVREEYELKIHQILLEKSNDARRQAEKDAELSRTAIENDKLYRNYLRAKERVHELESLIENSSFIEKAKGELESEKSRFREICAVLHSEVEFLRSVYPVIGLFNAKDSEVKLMEKTLRNLRPDHPESEELVRVLQMHRAHRDQLKKMVAESQNVFLRQARKIEDEARAAAQEVKLHPEKP